jgi:hypothetical protein
MLYLQCMARPVEVAGAVVVAVSAPTGCTPPAAAAVGAHGVHGVHGAPWSPGRGGQAVRVASGSRLGEGALGWGPRVASPSHISCRY